MANFFIKALKSLVLAIIISVAFIWTFSFLIGTEGMIAIVIGLAVIFTLIFCTYTIIDAIEKSKDN